MKKLFSVLVGFVGLVIISATTVTAGGIVNKQSLSVEYLRTFSRNGATDAADIVYYNPAGVMKMADGVYINTGLLYTAKDYSNRVSGTTYETDTPSIAPAVYALYKKNKWAGFFGFNIPGGGGKVDYDDGNARTFVLAQGIIASPLTPFDTIERMKLKADSYYYGPFIGCAYAVNDMFSISAAVRYVDAEITADGDAVLSIAGGVITPFNVKYKETANGWGGMIGLHISPVDDLDIGLRYETATSLDFEMDVKNDDTMGMAGIIDGTERQEDLPGLLGIGVFYRFFPELQVGVSGTLYLEKAADWDGRLQGQGNSWELATSFEYEFTPRFKASLGYMITQTEINADRMLPEAPESDVKTLCGGIAYKPTENLTLNLAVAKSIYEAVTTSTGVGLDKMAPALGVGVEWKFN